MPKVKSLRTGQGFKTTEIGEIPVDWEVAKVGDVCNQPEYGYTVAATEESVGPKFLRITDIQDGKVLWDKVPYCNCPDNIRVKYLLHKDDILFARTGASTGKSYLIRNCPDTVFASYLIRIVAKRIDPNFLYAFFNSNAYWKQIEHQIMGSAQGGINATLLLKIKLPLPPLLEQIRIAEILSAVDEAIERWTELIDKTKSLKKGLMQELMTHGISHTVFKQTEIGEIPVDWEVVKVGDVCEVVGGSTPSTKRKEYWNGGIPWATPTDITNMRGNVITHTEKTITELGLSNSAAKLLPEGSILLTSRATIGECAINTTPMATNQGFASLKCRYRANNWFVFYYIKLITSELQRLSGGSTFREVSKRSIRAIKLPLPPLPEQKRIAEILSAVDEKFQNALAYKEKLEARKKGLMQALLTGKVRVKV